MGNYSHIGLKKGIIKRLGSGFSRDNSSETANDILIDINVDGFSPFKSASLECWPILARSPNVRNEEPFVVRVFCGTGKPKPVSEFLSDFIAEVVELRESGVEFTGITYKCDIRFFLCDAPARAYMKQIVGRNGRKGCERCDEEGKYVDHCMTFSNSNGNLQTDFSFVEKEDIDHHRGTSPLQDIDKARRYADPSSWLRRRVEELRGVS